MQRVRARVPAQAPPRHAQQVPRRRAALRLLRLRGELRTEGTLRSRRVCSCTLLRTAGHG